MHACQLVNLLMPLSLKIGRLIVRLGALRLSLVAFCLVAFLPFDSCSLLGRPVVLALRPVHSVYGVREGA